MTNKTKTAKATKTTSVPVNDFLLQGGGSLFVLRAVSEAAVEWIENNVSDAGFNPEYPSAVYVEHGYIGDIVSGIQNEGLTIR